MNFNKFLQSLFGNKSSKDMKLIQPLVDKVKDCLLYTSPSPRDA